MHPESWNLEELTTGAYAAVGVGWGQEHAPNSQLYGVLKGNARSPGGWRAVAILDRALEKTFEQSHKGNEEPSHAGMWQGRRKGPEASRNERRPVDLQWG